MAQKLEAQLAVCPKTESGGGMIRMFFILSLPQALSIRDSPTA